MKSDRCGPRQLYPSASNAAWSPDGRHLIFKLCGGAGACTWWVGPAAGGAPIAIAAVAKLLQQHHLSGEASPDLWLSSGKTIVFAGKTGDQTRLWALDLNPTTFQTEGSLHRLTASDHDERSPTSAPDGRIVFASRQENIDVYSLPLDADLATTKGPLTRLTSDPSIDQRPSLSLDGKKLAWETSRGGNFEVWVKDLISGQERGITSGPLREHMPALVGGGFEIALGSPEGDD